MSQVRKLNENSNRRYQFYDRRIKNLLRKIHTDSREKPDKNSSEVSWFSKPVLYSTPVQRQCLVSEKNKQCNTIESEIGVTNLNSCGDFLCQTNANVDINVKKKQELGNNITH